ncbi:hypothetical protein QQZ08_003653 [Neonectria magnoliae]|uniref:Dynamin-type G domain-containing protein n=1 Tax=Neonectria magnoliae TaxID=2732573 RepID=A0ABR1I885_9HYPO
MSRPPQSKTPKVVSGWERGLPSIGELVDLSQFIVAGERSSGKSSVLEAISRVRFPVDDGVCTRFATELVLRHAKKTRVDVSVKFADSTKPTKSFQKTGFRESDLPDIIKEAKECMGFSSAGQDFSKDILRLEIEGSDMYPLKLVDLPGIFQTETGNQSLKGISIVNDIVESYMRQKNTIILAVITPNKGLASQITLRKTKEHDPFRERTIGILTKPDLIRPGFSEEREYIQVAKNEEAAHKLKLGSGAWKDLVAEDRGVTSLREKLSKVLLSHTKSSLPSVINDIEKKPRELQEELDRLGKPRESLGEERSFLLAIASDFQRLARDGIDGRYNDAFFGDMDNKDRKLRAQLRNLNRAFDYILTTKGSTSRITATPTSFGHVFEAPPPPHLRSFLQSGDQVRKELQEKASHNQGRELPGLPNKDLAIQLFQKQSAPWKKIAEYHLNQITVVTMAFVDEVFTYIMRPSESNFATEVVLRNCVDEFFDRKEKVLQKKLEELLRPYVMGYAFPLDSEFHRIASQKSQDLFANRFVNGIEKDHPELFDDQSKQKLNRSIIQIAISNSRNLDDGESGTDSIIDMMESYYEVLRFLFLLG